MKPTELKRTLLRGVAYAGIATSVYALSSGNALAVTTWGPWGVWKYSGEYSNCSASVAWAPCSGWSWGAGANGAGTLYALAVTGRGVSALARNSSGSQIGSVYDWWGGDTASVNLSSQLHTHRCRCESADHE